MRCTYVTVLALYLRYCGIVDSRYGCCGIANLRYGRCGIVEIKPVAVALKTFVFNLNLTTLLES